ncbi:MAG TPA: thioredoxin family protein [Candidatus Saccharimonadales bacterium]|nr:thioredoxin family protein [Candidatus Saccharimonadales bacterium]
MILLLAPLIALAIVAGAALLLRAQRGGQRKLVGSVVETPRLQRQLPSILYFTGETCTICHTAQKPALRTLAAGLGDDVIEIREIDIADEPALARQYLVMSLPTTIVLDAAGQVTDINVGFASGETLRRQLVDAGMPVAA